MTTSGKGRPIAPAQGKLGVLLPGMGAVATTFMAGVEAIRRGLSKPVGSLTQMGTIRLGKRTDNRNPRISEFVPLADLEDVVFGGWDIFTDNAYEAARKAGVLDNEHLAGAEAVPGAVKPMPAVFDAAYVKKLHGANVKKGKNKRGPGRAGDRRHRALPEGERPLAAWSWCGAARPRSTARRRDVHSTIEKFEKGLRGERPRHPALA